MKRKQLIEDGLTWWEQMIKDEEDRKELKQMIDDVNLLTPEERNENERIWKEIIKLKQNYVEYVNGKKVIQKKPFTY
jgi:hypothetical protein